GAAPDGLRAGLALSGGGIRSATFALGVLQAIAETPAETGLAGSAAAGGSAEPGAVFRRSLLSRFDYLSTVSGGGFIGGFLCSLFQPGRLRGEPGQSALAAADDAVKVLAGGPPGRIRSEDSYEGDGRLRAPLAWLRENGRYLVPTGTGDAVYAAALGLRGWLSLHFVIGTVLLALLAFIVLLRQWLIPLLPQLGGWERQALEAALAVLNPPPAPVCAVPACPSAAAGAGGGSWVDGIWWSSLFPLALLPLLLWALPSGVAFWLSFQGRHGRSAALNRAVLGMLGGAAVLLLMGWRNAGGAPLRWLPEFPWLELAALNPRQMLWLGLAALALLGVLFYIAIALRWRLAAEQGVEATRQLSAALSCAAGIALLGLVETLGQTLYLVLSAPGGSAAPVLTPAALVAALVWFSKKGAATLTKQAKAGWLAKLPLTTLGGIAGLLIFVLIAALWSVAVNALLWSGAPPDPDLLGSLALLRFLCWLMGAALLLAALTGAFPGFINLSSLQGFYSARLTRAYLGASNGERFKPGNTKALTVAEPLPRDNLWMDDFWSAETPEQAQQLKTLAPLHIINVTLNKTVDPAEQLVQRDRKGQPMAVLPFGFAIDGRMAPFSTVQGGSQVNASLSLGQWVGTSGAAFSTGIGRETSLGMSLLMGAANVRLGVWWGSGQSSRQIPRRPLPLLGTALGAIFRTQTYLSYEFRARFFGLRRRWQYLSDGGHFENTGIYELLRPQRQVELILASDNGADAGYGFADLANLIRLARIDLGVEIAVVRDFGGWPVLASVFGTPEQFKPGLANAGSATGNPVALLLRASRAGAAQLSWIVLLKPSNQAGAPADVQQYARAHPSFPQESTTDQFFDEAQWESYRGLGHHIARQLLRPQIFGALRQYIDRDGRPPEP
ncbi:MAG: hypothetical protein ABW005_01140, partial [Burkholderiaceae bacterium]